MSPAGGKAARSTRGTAQVALVLVECPCGERYRVVELARKQAVCPKKRCGKSAASARVLDEGSAPADPPVR